MTDGITSVAGIQQNPQQHPWYTEFENLSLKISATFSDYNGPLTADILLAGGELAVLEVSPHLHTPKLQGLRDPRILNVWPGLLAGKNPEMSYLNDSEMTSAYVRIYGDRDTYTEYFDASWIVEVEEFPMPRQFGYHALRKILYMKTSSSSLLKNNLEAFVRENGV
jgi:hypothetical protein